MSTPTVSIVEVTLLAHHGEPIVGHQLQAHQRLVPAQEDLAAVSPEGVRKGVVRPGERAGRLVIGREDGHRRHLRNRVDSLQA